MIRVKEVWKQYDGFQVLKGLNLDVHKGETLVILGRSGVGKSVLLKQIIGIESPDRGKVAIDGKCINEMNERQRYEVVKEMGMLFQGAALFDSMNIFDNTAFYLKQHGDRERGCFLTEEEIKVRVFEALEMVGLEGTQKKNPSDLSGGMRKRAGLARIIVYRPRILLYDEPTTGLDPITSMQINELIMQIKRELGSTSIVVTHDIRSALKVGDRLALHHDGKIVQIAEKENFFNLDDPIVKNFIRDAFPSKIF